MTRLLKCKSCGNSAQWHEDGGPCDVPNFTKQTLKEWFDTSFENGSACVEGMEQFAHLPLLKVRLGSSENTGFLQGTCGGDVIAYFTPDTLTRRPVVLVRDDYEGEKWDRKYLRQDAPQGGARPPRPHAKLRLAQTA